MLTFAETVSYPRRDPEIHPSHPFVGDHTFLCFLPFYHSYAFLVQMMCGLLDGERLVVMATYSFENYLGTIEKYKVRSFIREWVLDH